MTIQRTSKKRKSTPNGKLFLLSLSLLFVSALFSCAFKTTNEETDVPDLEIDEDSGKSQKKIKENWTGPQLEVPDLPSEANLPKNAPQANLYTNLKDAIKNNNEEKIQLSASQILALSPDDPTALNAMAMTYFRKSRKDAAIYLLKRAISKNPNSSPLYSNLGLVYLGKGERVKAIGLFRKALQVDSRDGVAASNLCAIFVREKDYDKGSLVCDIAYSQNESLRSNSLLNNYGISLMATGNYEKAREIFKQGTDEPNPNRELLHNYAILLVDHLQDYKTGLEIISKLKFIGPSSESINKINTLENKAKAGLK